MPALIMHQRARDADPRAARHLEREWRLFQAVDCGARAAGFEVWEAAGPAVVVGRSGRIDEQVDAEACRRDAVPVLRRASGGGAVVVGPGCLNYAVALSTTARPELVDVAGSFACILAAIAAACGVPGVAIAGGTDLALEGRKVSGNAQRRGRRALLHHGTLLYDFDPALAARYLREPARQPAYRGRRSHLEFIGNLPVTGDALRRRVAAACGELAAASVGGGRLTYA